MDWLKDNWLTLVGIALTLYGLWQNRKPRKPRKPKRPRKWFRKQTGRHRK